METFNVSVDRDIVIVSTTSVGASIMVRYGVLSPTILHLCYNHAIHLGISAVFINPRKMTTISINQLRNWIPIRRGRRFLRKRFFCEHFENKFLRLIRGFPRKFFFLISGITSCQSHPSSISAPIYPLINPFLKTCFNEFKISYQG